jgi:hypothetical protein
VWHSSSAFAPEFSGFQDGEDVGAVKEPGPTTRLQS